MAEADARSTRLRRRRAFVGGGFSLVLVLAAVGASGCGHDEPSVETEVRARYERFPSASQPPGTRPWPAGRFTGECRHSVSGPESYACLYSDSSGLRGFVCVHALRELEVRTASGPYDRHVWTDHDARPLPPEAVC